MDNLSGNVFFNFLTDLFSIVVVDAVTFKNYEEARDALDTIIWQLNTITSKMPRDENPSDYQKMQQLASFLSVFSHTMNEKNYPALGYSHHYRQAVNLVTKYSYYL